MKVKGDLVWERALSPVRAGTAAFGCPAARSSAPACGRSNSGFAMMKLKAMPVILRPLLALAPPRILAGRSITSLRPGTLYRTVFPASIRGPRKKDNESAPKRKGAVGQLIEENRRHQEERRNVHDGRRRSVGWRVNRSQRASGALVALSLTSHPWSS